MDLPPHCPTCTCGQSQPVTMTVRYAAGLLGVHENTVRNWMGTGRLEYVELPSGFRRPVESSVLAAARELSRIRR